ncbi:hypothetical protein ACRS8P_32600 [Burkholderia cenocepacia]|uniref:hypothetical protein n=1 Tax=Burkholderia pseudomultivorans TaxID=1207504 RepID=UPI002EDB437E
MKEHEGIKIGTVFAKWSVSLGYLVDGEKKSRGEGLEIGAQVTFDRRFHCGIHVDPGEQPESGRAIADGEVVAYRVCKNALSDGEKIRSDSQN